MISTYWLEKRKDHWIQLEQLLDQSHKHGLKSLTHSELQQLSLLYRQAAADLSALREDTTAQHYARSLNLLLARAHNTIYSGQKSSPFSILQFYRYTYPQVFREHLPLVTTAFLLFMAGAIIGVLLSLTKPAFMHQFLGPAMMDSIQRHEMWTKSVVTVKPFASSWIMTNNMTVGFTAFAFGIVSGLGVLFWLWSGNMVLPDTVTLLFYNGMMMGVVGTACWVHGMSLQLWSFVAPHGVLELPAIFIAGGAGLKLAQGLLLPGRLSRRDSIARAGSEAVRLIVGTVPILIIAGTIEGFVSPTALPAMVKFILAGIIGFFFFVYLFVPTKEKPASTVTA